MRFISFVVVAAATLYFNPISAFTGYSITSKCTKPMGVQTDQRGHVLLIPSNMIWIERQCYNRQKSSSQLYESSNKKKGGLDESVRTKLVSESIAPWRTLRLFLYFSLGSGALVGGLITLTGFAAVVSGAKEGNINTEVRILK
jgi:Low psii accumulation1 / Rep27